MTRGDRNLLLFLTLLAMLTVALPRVFLYLDPVGDNRARWYYDVVDEATGFPEHEASRWRSADGAPLPSHPQLDRIQIDAAPPSARAARALRGPAELAEANLEAELADLVPGLKTVHQVAYDAAPHLPPDRWGRPFATVLVVLELEDGTWGMEGGGTVISRGEDGAVDWGLGDDVVVSGISMSIPVRNYWPLFGVIALPVILLYGSARASAVASTHRLGREVVLATLSAAPVWAFLALLRFGLPMLNGVLEPLAGGLPLLVTPLTAFCLSTGALVWGLLFWQRIGRLRSDAAEDAPPAAPDGATT